VKKRKAKGATLPRGPLARIPLPKKSEQRHGDARKSPRAREKARLRRLPDE
jgi:hypothetical protein